jgi:NitT/TauT family transport system substrate-binding protein
MPRIFGALLALFVLFAGPSVHAADKPVIRVGVLKFGTVNWELDVIRHHTLDAAEGVEVEIVELAGNPATQVALQGGAVDMIVTDWLWVSRQRTQGADYTFIPYSTAVGKVMVPVGSPIASLGDLKGRKLGIAGSPLDKGWLMLRALMLQDYGFDPDTATERMFGAPPLLNEQIRSGSLDAVLNYWHFAARLQAAGLRPLIGIDEVTRKLGITTDVPIIGYVFSEQWAARQPKAVEGFARASIAAKKIMQDSDAEWQRLRPLTQAEGDATLLALRDGYRDGIPTAWGDAERADAAKVFAILAKIGGSELIGNVDRLAPGTFWNGLKF